MLGRVATSCLVVAAGVLSACATTHEITADEVQAVTAPPPAEVAVTRDGDMWTADYLFDRDALAWAFERSSLIRTTREPWRPRDWQVVTPGVVLERIGDLDVLRAVDGGPVPRQVSLRLTPSRDDLEADYSVLVFTDGSVAMFTGAFNVLPLETVEALNSATADRSSFENSWSDVRVTWTDRAGPVLSKGERLAQATAQDGESYVLFGQAQMKEDEHLITVVDPEMPGWIVDTIEDFAPRVIDYYA